MPDTLFHVSPTHGLTLLEPRETAYFNKPRQVCLAALEPMARYLREKYPESWALAQSKRSGGSKT